MNILETIESLKQSSGNREDLFDKYSKDEYVMYIASLKGYNKFLVHCANNKIKFPQVALYVSFITESSILDVYLIAGCKIDEHCISFACKMRNCKLIKYCIDNNIKPTDKDVNSLFCDDEFDMVIANSESYYMLNPETFISNCMVSESYEIESKFKLGNDIASCISTIQKSGIVLSNKIYQICLQNNIKIDFGDSGSYDIKNIEILCELNLSTIKKRDGIVKEIKSLKNIELNDACYDNLIKNTTIGDNDDKDMFLSDIINIKKIKISDVNLKKIILFSLENNYCYSLDSALKFNPSINIVFDKKLLDKLSFSKEDYANGTLTNDNIFKKIINDRLDVICQTAIKKSSISKIKMLYKKYPQSISKNIKENIDIEYQVGMLQHFCFLKNFIEFWNIPFIQEIMRANPHSIQKYLQYFLKSKDGYDGYGMFRLNCFLDITFIFDITKNNLSTFMNDLKFKNDLDNFISFCKTYDGFKKNDRDNIVNKLKSIGCSIN